MHFNLGVRGRALGVSFIDFGEVDEGRMFVFRDREFDYKGSYRIVDVSGFVV